MDESTYLEIDEPGDWEVIEKQLKNRKKKVEMPIPEIKMFLTANLSSSILHWNLFCLTADNTLSVSLLAYTLNPPRRSSDVRRVIEKQLKNRKKKVEMPIPEIKMFLTDCDGCLTDGGISIS